MNVSNKKERNRLNQRNGIFRWTYNQCVVLYKQSGNLKKYPKKQTLRDSIVKVDVLKRAGKQWALNMLSNRIFTIANNVELLWTEV